MTTAFDFNRYQAQFPPEELHGRMYRGPIPRIVCADGFSMSVQASETAYCSPRRTGLPDYDRVEVGYPSAEEPTLLPFAEDAERPTNTVYGYVPVENVNQIIALHGGAA